MLFSENENCDPKYFSLTLKKYIFWKFSERGWGGGWGGKIFSLKNPIWNYSHENKYSNMEKI